MASEWGQVQVKVGQATCQLCGSGSARVSLGWVLGGGGGGSGESRKQVGPASSSNGVRGNIPPGHLSGVRQFLWGSDTSGKPCAGGDDWLGQKSLVLCVCV